MKAFFTSAFPSLSSEFAKRWMNLPYTFTSYPSVRPGFCQFMGCALYPTPAPPPVPSRKVPVAPTVNVVFLEMAKSNLATERTFHWAEFLRDFTR